MMLYLAFDPGKTTGIVLVQWMRLNKIAMIRYAFERDEEGLRRYLVQLQGERNAEWLRESGAVFAVEQFRLYPWMGRAKSWSDLPEVLNQGAIKYVAWAIGIPLHYQTASAMKGLFPKKCAQRLEMKEARIPIHARDALCHALLSIVRLNELGKIPELNWSKLKRR